MKTMKRVVLVHGWLGSPHGDWFPWLTNELENKGFVVLAPMMPVPAAPEIKAWVARLDGAVGLPDRDTYFIGHSVGCQAIMRYLATLGGEIGGAIFVAPWFSLAPGAIEDDSDVAIAKPWLETPINFEKIKKTTDNFVAIFSDNDPWVVLPENSRIMAEKLGAKILVEHDRGHFSEAIGDGLDLPIVLREILKMAGVK